MSNGTPEYQQEYMPFQQKDMGDAIGGSASKNEGRAQNGMTSTLRL